MNKKEIGEIRRRLRRDRSNMTAIYGCYVRDNKEIISEFKASLGMLPENETEKYMSLFKKTLGGSIGKTLNDISFTTRQVAEKEEHYAALFELRSCALDDKAQREAFYQKVIHSIQMECNYLILLGCETYDVPFKNKNDDADADAGAESFTYIICAVCPVKETKPNLHYVHTEATFHDGGMIQAVNSPVVGFMFPAFDNRSTNIYGALYYSKDTSDSREAFVEAVFGAVPPVPADKERRQFAALLGSTLGDECSTDVVLMLHEQASAMEQMHKEARCAEPLTVDGKMIQNLLEDNGVPKEAVKSFSDGFAQEFGADAVLNLGNIIDTKHYTVNAPDVVIKTTPENAHNVSLRTIGGQNYVMVLVDDAVEVNGVLVHPTVQ